MSDTTSKYGEWLRSEIAIYQTYHNHKETMAWTATALFLGGGGAFLSAMPRIAVENQGIAIVVMILASVAIAAFVWMQFGMRWSAADIEEGLRTALAKLSASGNDDNLKCDVSTADPTAGFPQFVADEITAVAKRKPRRFVACRDPRWHSCEEPPALRLAG